MFGCPLRIAVLIPSFIFALCIVMGFYILSFSLTKSTTVSVIATLFFFLNGGFGFAYFFESAKRRPVKLYKVLYGILPDTDKL